MSSKVEAQRLRPKSPNQPPKTPQCSFPARSFYPGSVPTHYIKTRNAKIERYGFKAEQCSHHASVILKGKHYCPRHGGQVALSIVLKEEMPDGR